METILPPGLYKHIYEAGWMEGEAALGKQAALVAAAEARQHGSRGKLPRQDSTIVWQARIHQGGKPETG